MGTCIKCGNEVKGKLCPAHHDGLTGSDMYDDILRSKCVTPVHYDRMIRLLLLHNPSCKDRNWACNTINVCIRTALVEGDCSTGMCAAYRTNNGLVRLFLEPISARLDTEV